MSLAAPVREAFRFALPNLIAPPGQVERTGEPPAQLPPAANSMKRRVAARREVAPGLVCSAWVVVRGRCGRPPPPLL